MSNSFGRQGWYWKLFTICLLCFPCGNLFCWSTVWALCFLTHEIHKNKMLFQFQKQPSPSEKTCLPVLCKSSCSHIMLYQKTDLAFTPMDPFIHQFYPLTHQASKKSCRLHRDVGDEKELVLLCCTRQIILLYGAWWHMCSLFFALLLC